jgi:hypothetical protein
MLDQQHGDSRRSLVTASSPRWILRRRSEEMDEQIELVRRKMSRGDNEDDDDEEDDEEDEVEEKDEYEYGDEHLIMEPPKPQRQQEHSDLPEGLREGDEIDVRIVKVAEPYALCRPLDFSHIKGKISVTEMDEHDSAYDARMWVKENMIYRASVIRMMPPDRLLLSLKRVRRVLTDEFQPFTIILFNVPYDLEEHDLEKLMSMNGLVLHVTLSSHSPSIEQDHLRSFVFVTFLQKQDALAAIRKWNVTKMPVTLGNETYHYRVRAKMSHTQTYRQELQNALDEALYTKIARWSESSLDRRARIRADRDLRSIIPWYCIDRDHQEMYDHMGWSQGMTYSVKNNPRYERESTPRPNESPNDRGAPKEVMPEGSFYDDDDDGDDERHK